MIKRKALQFWLQRAFPSCLVVVFSFYVTFSQASFLVASAGAQETHVSSVDAGDGVHYYHASHSVFGSAPITLELKPVDESEANDNSHDQANIFWSFSLKQKFDVIAEKSLFLHLLHSNENRERVSLVILHHSWKSFPH